MYKKERNYEFIGIMEYEQEKAERAAKKAAYELSLKIPAYVQEEMDKMWDEYRAEQKHEYDRIQAHLENEYSDWVSERELSEMRAVEEEIEIYEAEYFWPWDDDDDFYYVEAPIKARAARRRECVIKKFHRLSIATIMDARNVKDAFEDTLNMSFCLKRGGHRVDAPKPLMMKTDMFQHRVKKENPKYEFISDSMKEYWHSDRNHSQRAKAKLIKSDGFGMSVIF
jgi:hypothetical protein